MRTNQKCHNGRTPWATCSALPVGAEEWGFDQWEPGNWQDEAAPRRWQPRVEAAGQLPPGCRGSEAANVWAGAHDGRWPEDAPAEGSSRRR